jgi:small subunit ribosomal protein S4
VGDVIGVRKREVSQKLVRALVEADPNRVIQPWLKLDPAVLEGTVLGMPARDDVQIPVEEQLVIEFCSR